MMDGNGLRDLDVSVLKSSGRRSAATNVDCCEMSRFFLSSDVFFFLSFERDDEFNSSKFFHSFTLRFCYFVYDAVLSFFFLFSFLHFLNFTLFHFNHTSLTDHSVL